MIVIGDATVGKDGFETSDASLNLGDASRCVNGEVYLHRSPPVATSTGLATAALLGGNVHSPLFSVMETLSLCGELRQEVIGAAFGVPIRRGKAPLQFIATLFELGAFFVGVSRQLYELLPDRCELREGFVEVAVVGAVVGQGSSPLVTVCAESARSGTVGSLVWASPIASPNKHRSARRAKPVPRALRSIKPLGTTTAHWSPRRQGSLHHGAVLSLRFVVVWLGARACVR